MWLSCDVRIYGYRGNTEWIFSYWRRCKNHSFFFPVFRLEFILLVFQDVIYRLYQLHGNKQPFLEPVSFKPHPLINLRYPIVMVHVVVLCMCVCVCASVSLSVCLSVCLSVHPCVCLFVYVYYAYSVSEWLHLPTVPVALTRQKWKSQQSRAL